MGMIAVWVWGWRAEAEKRKREDGWRRRRKAFALEGEEGKAVMQREAGSYLR